MYTEVSLCNVRTLDLSLAPSKNFSHQLVFSKEKKNKNKKKVEEVERQQQQQTLQD